MKKVTGAMPVHERLKSELIGKGVKNVLISSQTFGNLGWAQVGYTEQDTDKFRQFNAQQIDYEYLDEMEMQLAEGRKFEKNISADTRAAIVNETFVQNYQIENPIGATLPEPFQEYKIIGVAEDFNYSSLHSPIGSLVMVTEIIPMLRTAPDLNFGDVPIPKFSFKVAPENLTATIGTIQRVWQKVAPEQSFSYTFMDKNIGHQYQSESLLNQILSYSTGLAILIACLGLFGIATLTITQRTKEIGIRKVLGASTESIVFLLNKNFANLAIIATIIAAPFAYCFMQIWLADFAFQTEIN